MKAEEQADKLKNKIISICSCSDDEAKELGSMFINMLIGYTNKLNYYRAEPQIRYWKDVLKKL